MKTHDQLINEFKTFAYSLIEKLKPEDAEEIVSGLKTYKESYIFGVLEKRKQLQLELADYVNNLVANVDPSIDRMKLDDDLFEIGKKVWIEFTDKYWKSKKPL